MKSLEMQVRFISFLAISLSLVIALTYFTTKMNFIQQLIADVLVMMSNKYNSKLVAFLAVN